MVVLELNKKLNNVTVIEGFPGFGLVGTITTEYLIDHLKCEKIGRAYFEDQPAILAVHSNMVIDPISIYYNKKYNLVIIHSISAAQGIEWKAADLVLDICKKVKAKQIISLEGIGATAKSGQDVLYMTNSKPFEKKLKSVGVKVLDEGIIIGVTSGLMLKAKKDFTAIFAEVKSNLPDSNASARILNVLDKLLGLKVDTKPLIKQAEKFEEKLKGLMNQAQQTQKQVDKKTISYVG